MDNQKEPECYDYICGLCNNEAKAKSEQCKACQYQNLYARLKEKRGDDVI